MIVRRSLSLQTKYPENEYPAPDKLFLTSPIAADGVRSQVNYRAVVCKSCKEIG